MSTQFAQLIGTWRSDPSDQAGAQAYGDVTLKFCPDGTLIYIVHEGGTDNVIRMTFHIDSGFLLTDQPSHPRQERTRFEITADDKLALSFEDRPARFVRVR